VIRAIYLRICALGKHLSRDDRAAQLVEFAVSLPLLVLFVVGIFDFSGAFTQKQKLTNVAREAARVAAADPAGDVGNPNSSSVPASVRHAFKVVDSYLTANQLNDCGLATKTPTPSGVTWKYAITPSGSPPCGITLIINRGYVFPITSTTPPNVTTCASQTPSGQSLVGTCVSIQYAYPWKFGRAASLFGRNVFLPTEISAVAVALNEN
jgi:Flp pilus assembly protein TadG